MKRVRSTFLVFAGLAGFGLLLNDTQARDLVASMIGLVAAVTVALAITGGLCFLAQCTTPRAIAAPLIHISCFAKNLAKAIATVASGGRLGGHVWLRLTQGKLP
jgi:hypothetical protein